MIIIIMGVSGCGKTTIGKLLSDQIGHTFYDADDFHPKENIKKMSRGIPLKDGDRIQWLSNLAEQMETCDSKGGAILACSALNESYWQILKSGAAEIYWIHLVGSFDLIKKRMQERSNHFMLSNLLQ
jgi:carbohydrate kinase (thermoresistant glucokinase family)